MEMKAIVVETDGKYAIVRVNRKSACDGCHKQTEGRGCAMCAVMGEKTTIDSRAKNPIGAETGDTVWLETESGRVLSYAALVFVLPIAMGMLFYALGVALSISTALQYLLMLGGFCGSFLFLWFYSRKVIAKRCDAVIKSIIEASSQETQF